MNPTHRHKIHFSVAQAKVFLANHLSDLGELCELAEGLHRKGYDIYRHKYFGGLGPNGDREHPEGLERMVRIMKIFDAAGVLLKDVESGLIDFPHVRENGEEVYLCFKLGETSLAFWHRINDGFIGRQPLTEL